MRNFMLKCLYIIVAIMLIVYWFRIGCNGMNKIMEPAFTKMESASEKIDQQLSEMMEKENTIENTEINDRYMSESVETSKNEASQEAENSLNENNDLIGGIVDIISSIIFLTLLASALARYISIQLDY